MVETIAQALKLSYAAVELRQGGTTFEVAAHTGQLVDEPLRLPLIYQGEVIGQLVLGPRARGEGFSAADQRLLADVARQVGVAAYAVGLTAELQRSQERLALAREEESQRLRRDLYARLNLVLAGVRSQLGTIRTVIHDPAMATALVDRLRAEVQAANVNIWQSEAIKLGETDQQGNVADAPPMGRGA
jgi:GAF domain-containing protein